MCEWNSEQQVIIQAAKEGRLESLHLPKRYKCPICFDILSDEDTEISISGLVICKRCKAPAYEMCPLDHVHCSHPIEVGLSYCPICGKATCPTCGSHDVTQISRVTGYLADVDGWNHAKQQELKDRVRSNIIGCEPVLVSLKQR